MDPEKALVNWLNACDLGAAAYYAVPSTKPGAFMTASLTGGADPWPGVSRPVLELTCWAAGRREAHDLMESALAAVLRMPDELDSVFHVSVAGRFRDRDPDNPGTGPWRYHAVLELTVNE